MAQAPGDVPGNVPVAFGTTIPIGEDWLAKFNYTVVPKQPTVTDYLAGRRNRFALRDAYIRQDTELVLHKHTHINGPDAFSPGFPQKSSFPHPLDAGLRRKKPRAQQDGVFVHDTVKLLLQERWKGYELRWKRLLAKGGFGITTLWEAEFENSITMLVVIKFMRSRADEGPLSFEEEGKWHDRYRHASHTVQRLDLFAIAEQNVTDGRFFRDGGDMTQALKAAGNQVLILEYAEFGSLLDITQRAKSHEQPFPAGALWQLWESLVQGVAEVAYQAEFRSRWNTDVIGELKAAEAAGPQHVEQFFEKLANVPISHDVHFDLEESNILAFRDTAAEGHPPRFKLHDFGYGSYKMRREWEDRVQSFYWDRRHFIKWHRFLPEQTTKAWESLEWPDPQGAWKFTSENLDEGEEVAGRYGSWTNVFIIGRTMESSITSLEAALPFTAKVIRNGTPCYAWRLYEGRHRSIDAHLRGIISQCMNERPADRPSIINLLRSLVNARTAGVMDPTQHTRSFWKRVLGPLPPPRSKRNPKRTRRTHQGNDSDDDDSDDDDDDDDSRPDHLVFDNNLPRTAGHHQPVREPVRAPRSNQGGNQGGNQTTTREAPPENSGKIRLKVNRPKASGVASAPPTKPKTRIILRRTPEAKAPKLLTKLEAAARGENPDVNIISPPGSAPRPRKKPVIRLLHNRIDKNLRFLGLLNGHPASGSTFKSEYESAVAISLTDSESSVEPGQDKMEE